MSNQSNGVNTSSRRGLLKTAAAVAATGLAGSTVGFGQESSGRGTRGTGRGMRRGGYDIVKPDAVVLFQGDSITDAGRGRNTQDKANDASAMGRGYVFLTAARLLADRGAQLKVYNRGISGNKVYQLADRWDADCLALKPDVLSILIGVNDIWHKLNGKYDGTVEKYENDYNALLDRTKKALDGVKLVVCEPFVLRCGAVNDKWFPEFDEYRKAARRVADKAGAVFVEFQSMFDRALDRAPASHWAGDGVHPTMAGASLMSQEWIRTVRSAQA